MLPAAAGIASVDDDRLISEEDLMFAFSVWQVINCTQGACSCRGSLSEKFLLLLCHRNGSTS